MMKRIHPDYGDAIVKAFLIEGKEAGDRKINGAVNYWTEVLSETIGTVTLAEVAIIKTAFDLVTYNLYRQIKPEQAEKVRMLLRTIGDAESTGETSAEVMNNIHNNEVALVDKAKVHQDIQEIKTTINRGNDDCEASREQLIAWVLARGRKMELKFLGLWEEQA